MPSQFIKPKGKPDNSHPSRKGLAGSWSFLHIGDTGDDSGNKNHGTNNGATWEAGQYGPALRFAGGASTNRVDIAKIHLGDKGITYIFEGVLNSAGNADSGFHFDTASGTRVVHNGANKLMRMFISHTITDGLWQSSSNLFDFGVKVHLAFTWNGDGTTPIFYVNGVSNVMTLITSPVGTPVDVNESLRIGNNIPSNIRSLDGDVSIIQLHNRGLSAERIQQTIGNPWQAWQEDNIALWAAAQAAPPAAGVNLLDGLFYRKRLIA